MTKEVTYWQQDAEGVVEGKWIDMTSTVLEFYVVGGEWDSKERKKRR